jgi:hypothetical protein
MGMMRTATAAVLAAGILAAGATASAQTTVKVGYALAPNSHYGAGAKAFEDELARLTGGRFKVEQFPSSALGGERAGGEGEANRRGGVAHGAIAPAWILREHGNTTFGSLQSTCCASGRFRAAFVANARIVIPPRYAEGGSAARRAASRHVLAVFRRAAYSARGTSALTSVRSARALRRPGPPCDDSSHGTVRTSGHRSCRRVRPHA